MTGIAAAASSKLPQIAQRGGAMSAREPRDWPTVFEKNLNAGDLEQVVSLYEPGTVFVSPSGETLVGRDQIRQVLAGLIEKKSRFAIRESRGRAVTVADIAVLYTDFHGTVQESPDKSDGTWKPIVGDPNARS
jgi:SnoaL-like protein